VLHERLLPHADHFANTTIVRACGRHALGMLAATLGRPAEADHWFETAIDVHHRSWAPLLEAETMVEWARVIAQRGDAPDRVASLVGRARDLAEPLGAVGIVELAAVVGAS
jgi:hypothetical protein